MNGGARPCLAAVTAMLTACGPASAAVPRLSCRHFLATVGSAGDMPYSVVQSLKPWMDLHRKDANAVPGATADFLWGAESGGPLGAGGDRWIVVFSERASGQTRFALFAPIAPDSDTYRPVKPDNRHWFTDPTCRGVDAALDADAGPPR